MFLKEQKHYWKRPDKQQTATYLFSEFISSCEVYSSNIDVLASMSASLLALLNAAAVPIGDFGSTPPSINASRGYKE
jgi:hypothetical protein